MMWSDASASKLTVVLAVIHVSLQVISMLYRKITALGLSWPGKHKFAVLFVD